MIRLLMGGWLLSSVGCTGLPGHGFGGEVVEKACEDTAASISPWEPGESVPGWEDYACPLPAGAGYVATTLPTAILVGGYIGPHGEAPLEHLFSLLISDCLTGVCDPASYEPPGGAPYSQVGMNSNVADIESRGQGLYALRESNSDPYAVAQSEGVLKLFGWFEARDDAATNGHAEVCIERFRPDELRGTIAVAGGTLSPAGPYGRDAFRALITFDFIFVDHAGYYVFGTDGSGVPAGAERARIGYAGLIYDDAWPWEDITDSSVREELYARFTPWNEP